MSTGYASTLSLNSIYASSLSLNSICDKKGASRKNSLAVPAATNLGSVKVHHPDKWKHNIPLIDEDEEERELKIPVPPLAEPESLNQDSPELIKNENLKIKETSENLNDESKKTKVVRFLTGGTPVCGET